MLNKKKNEEIEISTFAKCEIDDRIVFSWTNIAVIRSMTFKMCQTVNAPRAVQHVYISETNASQK